MSQKKESAALPRGERFDRADYAARWRSPPGETLLPVGETPLPAGEMPPPAPVLDKAAIARAYLYSVGWDRDEVEQMLKGPAAPSEKAQV